MIDLKLTEAGDLDLSGFGPKYVTGAEQVAQRLRIKLRTFLGEVPLNLDAGVPWYEDILGVKPVDLNRVEAVLRDQITSTPEVSSIETFSLDFDAETRRLTIAFKALTIYGPVEVAVDSPEIA